MTRMIKAAVDFFLAPDSSSARRIKRIVADQEPGLNRIVGTWPELIAQAEAAYLLPPMQDDWREKLTAVASRQKDAFWSASLAVAPRETIAEIDTAITRLLKSKGPNPDWQYLISTVKNDSRLNRRLSDLAELIQTTDRLPDSLQKMANLLACQDCPIRPLCIYYLEDSMELDAWQMVVLDKLKIDAPSQSPRLQSILTKSLSWPKTANTALDAVRNLYDSSSKTILNNGEVRVLAVRDSLEEAEITAGLIQNKMSNGAKLSEIGLLLPNDPLCLTAVENVFAQSGFSLSGFHRSYGKRDLGRETLREFLLCLRKPAPIMAIAALLTSPLMPWTMEVGHSMAQEVMGGDVFLNRKKNPGVAHKIMDILNEGAAEPSDLQRQLKFFIAELSADEMFHDHLQAAREMVIHLQQALSGMEKLDWDRLLYLVNPESLNTAIPTEFWQEGIRVFHEGALPWCNIKHLFVLGFNEGYYPAGTGSSAVFSDAEWESIAEAGWPVATNDLILEQQRSLFVNQLSAATEEVTFLFSQRDAGGQVLEPSASLVFLARSLGITEEDLVLDLDRSEDVKRIIADLLLAEITPPTPPRALDKVDIEFGVDLLEVFSHEEDGLVPLSPSAAETLMVSPLAWLLKRLNCEPREWGPDEFDVMTAGTLAHSVFEELFQAGQPLPTEEEISKNTPRILNERMLQTAPLLRSPEWRVERYKFEEEILEAAKHWKRMLSSCKADLVAIEKWLRGHYGDIPLHGQSDLLVQLPSGKLLVVDYKKSSSGKRRDRMRSSFDLQAHLYRLMIQTGGLPGFDSLPNDIGIVYYLLNDTTALSDSPVKSDGSVRGWETPTTDTSSQAMKYLDRRLAQIRRGTVRLNTTEDETWWSKNAHLPMYALDRSPILRLFMRNEEVLS